MTHCPTKNNILLEAMYFRGSGKGFSLKRVVVQGPAKPTRPFTKIQIDFENEMHREELPNF